MQIRRRIDTSQPESNFDRVIEEALSIYIAEVAQILNKGLKVDDNFNAEVVTIADTGAADSENTLSHTLKRTPNYFIVLYSDKAVSAYDGGTSWTSTAVYLKFNAANCNVKVLLL